MKRLSITILSILLIAVCFLGISESVKIINADYSVVSVDASIIPEGNNVWYIGDSYSDNAYMKSKIAETFGEIYVNVQSGKRFGRDLPGNTSGLNIVKDRLITNKPPKYLIYELNTNDSDLNVEAATNEIKTLRSYAGKDCYIILMTAHSIAYDNSSFNTAVFREAQNDGKILVADWEAAIMGREDKYISADKLHPNQVGHDLLIKLFNEQLQSAISLANAEHLQK